MTEAFDTSIEAAEDYVGPWRTPRQMLAKQQYDSHVSIHDDSMAQKLGFKGGEYDVPLFAGGTEDIFTPAPKPTIVTPFLTIIPPTPATLPSSGSDTGGSAPAAAARCRPRRKTLSEWR